jgi:catechol 2,3-dioxygenase-like lactoylglutathione lyase family enzyme
MSATRPELGVLKGIHHVAVQTCDLDSCVRWYRDFFGCTPSWTLETFSPLSRQRLPGQIRLTELTSGDVRFHLFTRRSCKSAPPPADLNQFQHVCLQVASAELLVWYRTRWFELYERTEYRFERQEPASEIVIDDRGVQSFYAFDPNGLEYELTYVPRGA